MCPNIRCDGYYANFFELNAAYEWFLYLEMHSCIFHSSMKSMSPFYRPPTCLHFSQRSIYAPIYNILFAKLQILEYLLTAFVTSQIPPWDSSIKKENLSKRICEIYFRFF